MEFSIPEKDIKENIIDFGRKIGYFSIGKKGSGSEFSFVRPLQRSGYPRFHLFIRTDKGKNFLFNLHLDQKKPVYKSGVAHSAEYDGPIVDQEMERIKNFLNWDYD